MNINNDSLQSHLEQNALSNCYIIYGQEMFLGNDCADIITDFAKQNGYPEREVFYVNAKFNFNNITDSIDSPSLFCPQKIIEIRFDSDKLNKKDGQKILDIANHNSSNIIIIQAINLNYKVQKEKWFNQIIQNKIAINVPAIFPAQLPQWLNKRATKYNLNIEPNAIKVIIEFSEGNLLWSEQILKQFHHIGLTNITEYDVRQIISDNSTFQVADLSNAVLKKDKQAYKIVQKLESENQSPVLIAAILYKDINVILRLFNQTKPNHIIFKELFIWQSKQSLYTNCLNIYKKEDIEKGLYSLAELDKINKGAIKGDAWLCLNKLVMDLITS